MLWTATGKQLMEKVGAKESPGLEPVGNIKTAVIAQLMIIANGELVTAIQKVAGIIILTKHA